MMELHLKDAGWQYILIDYCWYYPYGGTLGNPPQTEDFKPSLSMDDFGRLLPAVDRFPSAKEGMGFKEIGDYIHSLGLKSGIHIMCGVPKEAVAKKMPIKGTNYTVDEIMNYTTCSWLNHMYGVDMSKPGSQEYFNSLFELYAEWGIDYIKIDDIVSPYYKEEIEGYRKAIDNCGREIVLSLSPGNQTPIEMAEHLKLNANMWRISGDSWDDWESLKRQFAYIHKWEKHIGPGRWPDADELPLGTLNKRGPHDHGERESNFTTPEKYTLMTLWSICRSPLFYGGDLMVIRPIDLKLLTNKEIIAVNQNSTNNHQLFRTESHVAWVADIPGMSDKYLAVFNISEDSKFKAMVKLKELGFESVVSIHDLWRRKDLWKFKDGFSPAIEAHGAGLFRIMQ
ncbi:MAG: alpha-galactosidase [Bacteroidetes bacterium]|nr:alpha-galactosidase [Bacteroidota bacterium]